MNSINTSQIIKEIFDKKFNKLLEDAKKGAKPIKVKCREEDYPLSDMYAIGQTKSANNEVLKAYEVVSTQNQIIAEVDFDNELSYMAFHALVWRELKPRQRALSLIWFNKLMSNSDKDEIEVKFKDKGPLMTYNFDRKKCKGFLGVNLNILNSNNTTGYRVMLDIMLTNHENQVNIELINTLQGVKPKKFTELELVNAIDPIEHPEGYEDFIVGLPLTNSQEKDFAIYGSQPIIAKENEIHEQMDNYMQIVTENTGMKDVLWTNYFNEFKIQQKKMHSYYKNHLGQFKKEQFYYNYYKDEINELKRQILNNINEFTR